MTAESFTVELVRQLASERRARAAQHDAIAHAAVFDRHDLRVVERDGTEYTGRPIIEPGAWESIGLLTPDGIEWFHAGSLVSVEAVPA